jgi:hypothetical protein
VCALQQTPCSLTLQHDHPTFPSFPPALPRRLHDASLPYHESVAKRRSTKDEGNVVRVDQYLDQDVVLMTFLFFRPGCRTGR